MKVAAIQFEAEAGAIERNRQKAAEMIREAAKAGAELIVLPEFWPAGFEQRYASVQAETMRGASINILRKLAKERKIFIVGGSLAEKRDGRLYNTAAAINDMGEITAKYRKVHLYPHEKEVFSPGDEWKLSEYAGLTIGMMICYDIYFPEFARNLCLRGAQLLVIPSACEDDAIERLHILAVARAVENHCFVIVANGCKGNLAGCSIIASPRGQILAKAGHNETALMADLDMDDLHCLRKQLNTVNDRRNILDEIDNSQL